MPGTIEIVIGPNGFGKTTYLEATKKELEQSGVSPNDILYLPSEIKLLDEVKDTTENSTTMEYIVSELIQTPDFIQKRQELFEEVDRAITANTASMNKVCDEVLGHNGQTRTKDFISSNSKIFIKSIVSICQDDVKRKMGSGQRMHLLLRLVERSSKSHIFLDEPEKYSHPSMLNETARIINKLVECGKSVHLATHSPKLLAMLDFDLADLRVINDDTHERKPIPFSKAVEMGKKVNVGSLPTRNKRYYVSEASVKDCLARRHKREFLEALFSKRVYLCEGVNDVAFVNFALWELGGYFDDYTILSTWGKYNTPAFFALLDGLGVEVVILFDRDDETRPEIHAINEVIRSLGANKLIEFDLNIEKEFGFTGPKQDTLGFIEHLESQGSLDEKYRLV